MTFGGISFTRSDCTQVRTDTDPTTYRVAKKLAPFFVRLNFIKY